MNIALLECDHVDERFIPIAGGYREMFEALLRPQLPGLRFTYFDVCRGELPETSASYDGYLCTGSRFSVYDELEWIYTLKKFVRDLHEQGERYVGICFGHQVLAASLGGTVLRAPQGWGIGVHDMTVLKREPWMEPPLENCRMQYMHADQVFVLPPGGVLLGRGEHCEVSMFHMDETMLGIEGHPEFSAAYSEALIQARAERLGPQTTQAGLHTVNHPTDSHILGQWIARFLAAPY